MLHIALNQLSRKYRISKQIKNYGTFITISMKIDPIVRFDLYVNVQILYYLII